MTTVAGFDYKYDNVGNRKVEIGLHNTAKSAVYNYDTTYKVTGYKQGVLNGAEDDVPTVDFYQDWTQDTLGNWSSFDNDGTVDNRSHDSMNQITSTGFTHDDTGNMTSDGSNDYEYDAFNRMIKATVGSTVTEYSYDAFNRRIQKDVGGSKINYIYNEIYVIEEQDVNGLLLKDFVNGEQYIDEVVMMNSNGNDYYFLEDYRNSIVALSDSSKNIVERYEYTAFGERTTMDDLYVFKTTGLVGNDYGFTGRRHDSETGIMYFRARYYSGLLGRFLSRDPKSYVDGMNLRRSYFGINGVDPLGLNKHKKKTKKKEPKKEEPKKENSFIDLIKPGKKFYEIVDKAKQELRERHRASLMKLLNKLQECAKNEKCKAKKLNFKKAAKILIEKLFGKGDVDIKGVADAIDKAISDEGKFKESLEKGLKKGAKKLAKVSSKKFKKLNKRAIKILKRLNKALRIIDKLYKSDDLSPDEAFGAIADIVDFAFENAKDIPAFKYVAKIFEPFNDVFKIFDTLISGLFIGNEIAWINSLEKVACDHWVNYDKLIIEAIADKAVNITAFGHTMEKVLDALFGHKYWTPANVKKHKNQKEGDDRPWNIRAAEAARDWLMGRR
ncbi:MAG: hypothetical protein COA79_22450 [Planctomycetota bacterium]|nr:MAG: hypothetical protein COA79_22450 [Planctomycetota bacterium]